MKIIAMRHLEDCFDGSFIKEIVFDEPISKDFVFYLGKVGKFQYFDTFARPFFKVIHQGHYEFKGVEGNRAIRMILKNNPEETLTAFRTLVSNYVAKQDQSDKFIVLKCGD